MINYILNKFIEFLNYFLVPSRYQNERRFILENSKQMLKESGIKPIPIIYNGYGNCCFNSKLNIIQIGIGFFDSPLYTIFDYIKTHIKTKEEKILFVLAHEVAHYFQFIKYPK